MNSPGMFYVCNVFEGGVSPLEKIQSIQWRWKGTIADFSVATPPERRSDVFLLIFGGDF